MPNCSNITDVTENKCKLFQFGDMRNKQTNVLGGGNLTIAMRNLESMFYIGILEYYDLSICLLSFQLGQYNTERCSCRSRESKDLQSKKIAPTKNAAQNQLEFGEDELQRIDLITGVDNLLYKYGIELFFVRVRQAEAMLGDSILCKWKN